MAKSLTPNALRDQFLAEYNLSVADIEFEHREWDSETKAKSQLFTGDKNGDMRIYYPTLSGYLHRHNKEGKWADTFRVRKALPYVDKKTGKLVKYNMVGNNCIYWPPAMVQAFRNRTPIDTLVVVEGEKKAFVASLNGFDICGISGIWNFCEKGEKLDDRELQGGLLAELPEFIAACQVKTVVLMHDADALNMNNGGPNSATQRPFDFYQALKRFAELIFQEGVKLYYTYINPHLGPKGLDDLIISRADVVHDFCESIADGDGTFTSCFCTRRIHHIKATFIKDIFHLNDPEEFYRYHKAEMKRRQWTEFRFENRLFKITADDKLEEVKTQERDTVWVTDGRYWGPNPKGQGSRCFSNFTMNVLFLMKSSTEPKRIVAFKNVLGQEVVKALTMDDLVSVSNFRKKLISDGSYIFKGDMFELLNLQEILFKEEKLASELTNLGWQRHYKFYAFSNGVTSQGRWFPVDEYGIVSVDDSKFFLPAFSNLYPDGDQAFENERNFCHIEHQVSFEYWAAIFLKLYKHNGAIGICFYIASLFRDIIFGAYKEFPLLNLFGQKGSGKSTMAKSLMALFGKPQNAMSLENASSTKKGMYRKFAQFSNALVWLDEYKNSIHPDLIGMCKNLYDGIGYERAQTSQDNRTHSNPVLSSTILSGQDMPTADPALFSRVLLLMFTNNHFDEADKKNYSTLTALEKKGLTSITLELLSHRQLIEEQWFDTFKQIQAKLSGDYHYSSIPERMLKNAALVMAPVFVLINNKKIDMSGLQDHFSVNVLYAKFKNMLDRHHELMRDNEEIGTFWETIEILFNEGLISVETDHFRFKEEMIAFRFNLIYAAYAEKHRKMHGRNGIDKMTLTNYLKASPAFKEVAKSFRFENSNSSAFVFEYKKLGITLQKELKDKDGGAPPQAAPKQHIKNPPPVVTGGGDNDDLPF
jgi:hypothetical protein